MRPFRLLLVAIALALLAASAAGGQGSAPAPVRVIELDGDVDPVTALFVENRIEEAEDAGAPAVVIRMDTPGGLVSAARDIVSAMEEASVPVTVWVGPPGSRAGSAGAYISAAGDALGMAPGTNIGSATPISSGGEDLDAKVRNDLAASIAALAEQNGHDPEPYRAMVTESLNLTANEALAQDVADTVQPTIEDFVAWLDGRTLDGGEVVTAGAPIEVDDLPWYLRVLQVVTDPNLVFLLLILGIAGIAFEIFNPGAIVPGVVGAISLVLALAGLAVMPFTWIGVILILLGIGLFIGETQVGGLGVFTVGGVVALALGGAFLFDSSDPALTTSPWIAVVIAVLAAAAFVASARLVLRARRRPVTTGGAEMIGEIGTTRGGVTALGGQVSVNGEIWSARTADGVTLPPGTAIRVVRVHPDDLTLTVEPREG
ncbi:MAG: nodulation protein NfeD [Thermoleophilia bacterium]|nr:nodulation protein NfeD [Thermoleophilia bacterium]